MTTPTHIADADLPPLPEPYLARPTYGPLFTAGQLRNAQRQAIKDWKAKQEVVAWQYEDMYGSWFECLKHQLDYYKDRGNEVRSLIVKETA